MGLLDALRITQTQQTVQAALPAGGYSDPSNFPIVTPWSSGDLQRIVFTDIFGTDIPPNTRNAAMRLPALVRARNLLVSTISRLPLRELTDQDPTPEAGQPGWITATGDPCSHQLRMAWTVDDLIFYGWSLWWRTNDATGRPVAMSRVNQDEWTITTDSTIEVNGQPARDDQVVLFGGLHEGILSYGVDVIADTRCLYKNVRDRLANPVPQIDLHQTSGADMTDTEIDALITRWSAARRGANGGVAYTSKEVQANELGIGADSQLMIEARNAAAVDLARLVGVSAGRLDATAPKASLNYETTTGRNQELVDFDLALYMTPITARLSQDDITPPGRRVDFDLTDFIAQAPSVAGPPFED